MARMVICECPVCAADSRAPAHHYLIWVCTTRDRKFFTFTCQKCGTPVAKDCPPVIENLLAAEGVPRKLCPWCRAKAEAIVDGRSAA